MGLPAARVSLQRDTRDQTVISPVGAVEIGEPFDVPGSEPVVYRGRFSGAASIPLASLDGPERRRTVFVGEFDAVEPG